MKQQKVENQHQQDQNYYLQKIFSLKQKTNQILSATLEKIKYCLFEKTVYGSFKKRKPFREMWIYSYTF